MRRAREEILTQNKKPALAFNKALAPRVWLKRTDHVEYRKLLRAIFEALETTGLNFSEDLITGIGEFSWKLQKSFPLIHINSFAWCKSNYDFRAYILPTGGYWSLQKQYEVLLACQDDPLLQGMEPFYIAQGGFELPRGYGKKPGGWKTYHVKDYPWLNFPQSQWREKMPLHPDFEKRLTVGWAANSFTDKGCLKNFCIEIHPTCYRDVTLREYCALIRAFLKCGHMLIKTEKFTWEIPEEHEGYVIPKSKVYFNKKTLRAHILETQGLEKLREYYMIALGKDYKENIRAN